MAQTAVRTSKVTGLTPTQERACSLLASGENAISVAQQVGVEENTIFLWQSNISFKCFYNRQRYIRKEAAVQSLFGLYEDAVKAIRESLNSENESVKLKAATYIVDKLQNVEIGRTDIIEQVKAEATHNPLNEWGGGAELDEDEYRERLNELGIEEQDYKRSLK